MTHARMDTLHLQFGSQIGGGAHAVGSRLFARAREQGRRGQFWARLAGRPQSLMALAQVRETCAIDGHVDGGAREVSISQIRGSQGRSHCFDRDFNPLFDEARSRWLNIAAARRQGRALPPVRLIQVGEVYYVMDGHHRISVARALGDQVVEARIAIWKVTGPLPWDVPRQAPGPQRTARRLKRRAALGLRAFLVAAKVV